jgi:hypothetical protein
VNGPTWPRAALATPPSTSPIYRLATRASPEILQALRKGNPNVALLTSKISLKREEGLPAWEFKFLKWVPGEVSQTELAGDTVSGPFSGCLYSQFTREGRVHAAHVGSTEDEGRTQQAKQEWNDIVGAAGVTDVAGAFPEKLFSDQNEILANWIASERLDAGACKSISLKRCACLTPAGSAFGILVGEIPERSSSTDRNMWIILSIRPMKMVPWKLLRISESWLGGVRRSPPVGA